MQKQPKILNYKNLSREKYEYQQPHKTQTGDYQSICNYRLTRNQLLPFYFETPKLKTSSGIVRIDNNYYIDLELTQSGDSGEFYDFLIKNDENNISVCHQNAKDWFNQVMPLNIVENYYKTPILLRSNGNLPIIRIKIPSYKGNILTEIFNIRKEKINDVSCIQEGDTIIGILEFIGLKFLKQNFSPCYELQKIKIFKDNDFRAIPNGYIFSDVDEKIDLLNNNMKTIDTILEQPVDIPDTKSIEIKKPIPMKLKPINIHIADSPEPNIKTVAQSQINITTTETTPEFVPEPEPVPEPLPVPVPEIKQGSLPEPVPELKPEPLPEAKTNKNEKSLYDLIKETTLKSLYLDDTIFMNNNKHITNNILKLQSKKSTNTHQLSQLKINNVEDINLNIDYNLESPHSSTYDEQDLENPARKYSENEDDNNREDDGEDGEDNDQDLENPEGEENDNSDEDDEENEDDEEGEQDLENPAREENDDIDEDENENENDDSDEDEDEDDNADEDNGDIDFNTLNDLEVIEFE